MKPLSYTLNQLSQWMLQATLISLLFASLAVSQVHAVELKPNSSGQSHSWWSSSSASASANQSADSAEEKKDSAWDNQNNNQNHDQNMNDHDDMTMEKNEERIAHKVVEQIMEELPKMGDGGVLNGGVVGMAMLIPIIAVLLIFGGPILLAIVLIAMHYKSKRERQQIINNNIDKLIAAGRDIPPELLRGELLAENNYTELLHKGIKNLFVGLGLLIFLTIFIGIWLGSVGFIVMAVGISQLIIWKISAPKNQN